MNSTFFLIYVLTTRQLHINYKRLIKYAEIHATILLNYNEEF